MKKIMVSAGEVSGDAHGKYLVRELKKLLPDAYFFGLGSENLLAEGVDVKFDITKRGSIGIFEALPNVLPIYLTYLKMVALMKKEKPDLLLLIDSQGINMPLAKAAKKLGIKTVYYIAPQEWLWGTPRGVKKVASTLDQIIAIFEKENEIYKLHGANVAYSGHPLVDIVKPTLSRDEARKQLLGDVSGPVISICPGSRTQEIKGLFPILLKAGKLIQQAIPEAKFVIPAASTDTIKQIFGLIEDFRPKAVVGHTYDILAASDLAICTSGTINLEASILGTPNIMVYKLNPLTYFLGKYVLKIGEKLPYFSMPNLLLEEKVIPELVMEEANPTRIAEEAVAILRDGARQEKMKASFEKLQNTLGSPGVISRCAKKIIEFASL
ncbi:MAG: lipid-A-disaccharide synthase [Candidatus Margulisbacteria bacterium]|nr:lipid-A-disaccharide synthase [Candidatus Margulisiibacteriota bacterium]